MVLNCVKIPTKLLLNILKAYHAIKRPNKVRLNEREIANCKRLDTVDSRALLSYIQGN